MEACFPLLTPLGSTAQVASDEADGHCLPFPVKIWLWPCVTLSPGNLAFIISRDSPPRTVVSEAQAIPPASFCLPRVLELSLSFLQKHVKMPKDLEALLSFLKK